MSALPILTGSAWYPFATQLPVTSQSPVKKVEQPPVNTQSAEQPSVSSENINYAGSSGRTSASGWTYTAGQEIGKGASVADAITSNTSQDLTDDTAAIAKQHPASTSNTFWTDLGYPQYEGKYQGFDIPTDEYVSGVSEVPATTDKTGQAIPSQLQIQFGSYAQDTSRKFYTDLGYPQYAGVYQPFDIPSGEKVKSLSVVGDQLQVQLESLTPAPVAKSYSEQLADIKVTPLFQSLGIPSANLMGGGGSPIDLAKSITGQKQQTHPFSMLAGLVSPFEALGAEVWDVGSFIVGKGFGSAPIPSTALSEAIGGGIKLATGQKVTASDTAQRMSADLGTEGLSQYEAGSIFGDIFLGYGIGKVADAIGLTDLVSKITSPVTSRVTEAIQSRASDWLTASYDASVKAGGVEVGDLADTGFDEGASVSVPWKPSTLQKAVMAITGATPKELPPSIIGLPTLEEVGADEGVDAALIKGANMPELFSKGGVMDLSPAPLEIGSSTARQLPSLWAGEDLLDFTTSVHTAGFGLTTPAEDLAENLGEVTAKVPNQDLINELKDLGFGSVLDTTPKETESLNKMIKGGRYFDLTGQGSPLDFGHSPWLVGGKLTLEGDNFTKGISWKDFFKTSEYKSIMKDVGGSSSLPQLLNVPSAILDTGGDLAKGLFSDTLPKLTTGGVTDLGKALGLGGLGLSSLGQTPKGQGARLQIAPVTRLKPNVNALNLSATILGTHEDQTSWVAPIDISGTGAKQKPKIIVSSVLDIPTVAKSTGYPAMPKLSIPSSFLLPSKRSDDSARRSGKSFTGRRRGYKSSLWSIPFPSEKELARYVIGKPLAKISKQKVGKHRK